MSNPAASQAFAMRTVWSIGSMLSCRTPILRGGIRTLRVVVSGSSTKRWGLGLSPGMLQALYQRPHCLVKRRWHACFLSVFHDRAIHEINLRLSPRQHILQHAGAVFAWSIGAFPHQRTRIVIQADAERT